MNSIPWFNAAPTFAAELLYLLTTLLCGFLNEGSMGNPKIFMYVAGGLGEEHRKRNLLWLICRAVGHKKSRPAKGGRLTMCISTGLVQASVSEQGILFGLTAAEVYIKLHGILCSVFRQQGAEGSSRLLVVDAILFESFKSIVIQYG